MFRPIDANMSLAADVMRNTAAIVRQGDLHQAYNAIQAKAAAEHEKHSVSELTKTNSTEIRNETEDGQKQQYEALVPKPKHKNHVPANPEDYSIPSDPYSKSTIDISV